MDPAKNAKHLIDAARSDSLLTRVAYQLDREDGYRRDGWQNALTGFGTGRDKTTANQFVRDLIITDDELSALYHGSDTARKIVDLPGNEMLRQGYDIDCEDKAFAKLLKAKLATLKLVYHVRRGYTLGRLFGGAVLYMGAHDGRDPDLPLNPKGITDFDFLQLYDRRFAWPHRRYMNPAHPKYGQPEIYQLQNLYGGQAYVHESRLIVFRGAPTDDLERMRLNSWDYSVLQTCEEAIAQFDSAYKSMEIMLTEASIGIFTMKGLLAAIASGQQQDLMARMTLLDMGKSAARSIMLDADSGEAYSQQTHTFAGVADMLDRCIQRLSMASGIPVTVLMGQSPAGMNATGASDIRIWYDKIRGEQEEELAPAIHRIAKLTAIAMGAPTTEFTISFPELWQESPSELADRKLKIAQSDEIYLENDVITPDECAENRFGGHVYSSETTIDMAARRGAFLPAKTAKPAPGAGAAPAKPGTPATPAPAPAPAPKL